MEAIWPGSGSAVSGNTPFGLYDDDSTFQSEAPKFATWAARRLGYPIMAIELQDSQFYTCFEEAITEYSAQVNQFGHLEIGGLDTVELVKEYGTPLYIFAIRT